MTKFLARHGTSSVTDWREKLNKWMPNYHIDVAVSVDGTDGSFVATARWLERVSQSQRT